MSADRDNAILAVGIQEGRALGYDTAIRDVLTHLLQSARESKELWLEKEGTYIGEYHRGAFNEAQLIARAIERGEAKGASHERLSCAGVAG